MQIFKAFFKVARKHLLAICIYYLIYMFITFMLTFTAKDEMASYFKSDSLTIYIMDEDQTDASRALTNYLSSLHEIADLPNDWEALADQLYYRTLNYVLTIPKGFAEHLAAQETENLLESRNIPGSTTGYFVDQQITQYTQTLQLYLAGGYSFADAIAKTDASAASLSPVSSISFQNTDETVDTQIFYFYQYLPYIFITVLFSGLTPILVTFSKDTLSARMSCSALPLIKRNFSLAISAVLYSLVTWILFIFTAFVLLGKNIFHHYELLGMANSFVFFLFATALALFISLFAPDDNVVNMLSNIIGLSMSFLCGVFVPQYLLGDSVLSVGKFLPAYWYIKNNNMLAGLSNEAMSMDTYFQCIGIQLLFTAAVFAMILALSKSKAKQL